ncbi:MAG TPA: preprotein translocase subunit SecY [Clostridiales bacterium]|nr:MAG: preprotein translocase subunit SecY [Firmicutes bacterium ADurb.Bin262]HOU09716.1 preprotein translocase subunit SecY [Clostridiales bacterium]HQK72507.1 preprotein translocase subunit SecY [Clostridiales bacterium]
MIQTMINAWKIADIRKKILFTAFIILVFRIGAAIPVPFANIGESGIITDPNAGNFMNYLSMMTGDAFNYGTIFAMSITPYINASIIMQLLTVAIPYLERLQKEGEEGRKKIASITRFVTVGLGLLQSTAYYFYLRNQNLLTTDEKGLAFTGFWMVFQAVIIILCFTAGTALIMWLGEQINDKGIGNGISIILFAGIVSRLPTLIAQLFSWDPAVGYIARGGPYYFLSPFAAVCLILMIAYIVWMDNSERRIPVQYAKRVVGRKMYGGQSTHIPIKVNMSGVMPIIFASSILSLPPTVELFMTVTKGSGLDKFFSVFKSTHWAYGIMYFVMIIGFAYFYASIQYNPIEMSNNIRKNSGTIPGIRPGEPTAKFIAKILSKITLLGALMISVVALFPILFSQITTFVLSKTLEYSKGGMNISLGGTSIIIIVGVALETVKQLESQMMMRHYKGFLD